MKILSILTVQDHLSMIDICNGVIDVDLPIIMNSINYAIKYNLITYNNDVYTLVPGSYKRQKYLNTSECPQDINCSNLYPGEFELRKRLEQYESKSGPPPLEIITELRSRKRKKPNPENEEISSINLQEEIILLKDTLVLTNELFCDVQQSNKKYKKLYIDCLKEFDQLKATHNNCSIMNLLM